MVEEIYSMLEFETSNGNKYIWDNELGLFFPAPPIFRDTIDALSLHKLSKEDSVELLRNNYDKEDISYYYDWIKKYDKIRPTLNNLQSTDYDLTPEYIRTYILRNGLRQLTLNVTESCNFKCKYCTYTPGNYSYGRVHSSDRMDFHIAKKAIDHFFTLITEGKRYHPTREITVGFFGGEPLINFDVIKKAVEYIENTYNDIVPLSYTMTTNGSLLDKEKADWLMQKNFTLAISIDGPEEEHNRSRVYASGKGTFEDVIKNVGYLMNLGYERIFSTTVWDWNSNFFKLLEFFYREDIPIIGSNGSVNPTQGCKYFQQFSKEDYLAFMEHYDLAKKIYIKMIENRQNPNVRSFLFNLFNNFAQKILVGPTALIPQTILMPYSNSCIPGWKISVDVNGNFYICEKIKSAELKIGDVNGGLDFDRICELLRTYYNALDLCPSCKVSKACPYCFVQLEKEDGFSCSSKICKDIEADLKKDFAEAVEIAEANETYIGWGQHVF